MLLAILRAYIIEIIVLWPRDKRNIQKKQHCLRCIEVMVFFLALFFLILFYFRCLSVHHFYGYSSHLICLWMLNCFFLFTFLLFFMLWKQLMILKNAATYRVTNLQLHTHCDTFTKHFRQISCGSRFK